jgi:uncharacterized membrane protein HdeD (DUF308 family)
MKEMLKKLKANFIITGIIYLILGLVMLIIPGVVHDTIAYVLGAAILVMGIVNLAVYLGTMDGFAWLNYDFIFGLMEVFFGLFVIANPRLLLSIINIVFGIILLAHGVNGISRTIALHRYENSEWKSSAVLSAIACVLGFVIMMNPFGTTELLFRIIGICLIYSGISDFVAAYKSKKAADMCSRNPMDGSIDGFVEGEFRDIK